MTYQLEGEGKPLTPSRGRGPNYDGYWERWCPTCNDWRIALQTPILSIPGQPYGCQTCGAMTLMLPPFGKGGGDGP